MGNFSSLDGKCADRVEAVVPETSGRGAFLQQLGSADGIFIGEKEMLCRRSPSKFVQTQLLEQFLNSLLLTAKAKPSMLQ